MNSIQLLQQLVQIPSPNPPGDTRGIAAFIAEQMRAVGCRVKMPAPAAKPEARNVIASLGQGPPAIMLHAHIDTVPIARTEAEKWHVDPYAAVIKDGALYGKGSIDDKAPLASMMLTMMAASKQPQLQGTLVLVAAAEEETGGQLGTKWLADEGHLPECDFIIVGEQTDNKAATAHKGVMRAIVRASGKSVHATNPDRGVNAIVAMVQSHLGAGCLSSRTGETDSSDGRLPDLQHRRWIEGGSTANAVPDACLIELDRRMIPREDPQAVIAELQAVVHRVDVAPATVSIGDFVTSNWFDSSIESALSQTFLDCIRRELNQDPGPIGYLPGSDAKHLMGLARGDMVIFGPRQL